MNRIYKSVWNDKTATFVAVSELVKGGGKASSAVTGSRAVGGVRTFVLKALAQALLLVHGSLALAAPLGGVVVGGGASIVSGASTTTITQSTQNAAIDWQKFDIKPDEAVHFVQPSSSAVILNRILSADPSTILGSLSANGKVFLVNPNGIVFGQGATVNVGGLVASTLGMTTANFMASQYVFAGAVTGDVTNLGTLNANGGYVALLGATVNNKGLISARLGTVALVSGTAITLDVAGDSLLSIAIDQGAVKALVDNGGVIEADGGNVIMSARSAGDLLPTVVNNTGVIRAQTVASQSGTIKLLGDMQSGTVTVSGTLDASAVAGESGGAIETSAARVVIASDARITTASPLGKTGSWLIDPHDFNIGDRTTGSAAGTTVTPADISGDALSTALSNNSVSILSGTGSVTNGVGNINVNSAVAWNKNTLTLTAAKDINVNATLSASGTSALAMNTGSAASGDAGVAGGQVHYGLTTTGFTGKVDFAGRTGPGLLTINGDQYTVLAGLGVAGSTTGTDMQGMNLDLTGHYALGGNIDASGVTTYVPVGAAGGPAFTGTFDGLGHTISNLVINTPAISYVGLFGAVGAGATPSTIRNIGLLGGSMAGASYVGGLAGWNTGIINDSFASADISQASYIGGLVGWSTGTITNSYATGRVTGASYVGGLVGWSTGDIVGSHATGSVDATGTYSGGLVGWITGNVRDSYAMGNTTAGTNYAGGLVGISPSGDISGSHATGDVSAGTSYAGGLVGTNVSGNISKSYATGNVYAGTSYAGGLTATITGNIDQSYATGNVLTPGGYAGGLATVITGDTTSSYATGSVSASDYAGGLVGVSTASGAAAITTSYATGVVTATAHVGGLGGVVTGPVVNSYWNVTTSGQAPVTGSAGQGLTTAQMQSLATYGGVTTGTPWNFAATWVMNDGLTNPLLRTFMTPLTVTANSVIKTYDGQTWQGGTVRYSSTPINPSSPIVMGGSAQGASTVNPNNYVIGVTGPMTSGQQADIITYVDGSLTINPFSLVVGAAGINKTYDATTTAAVNLTDNRIGHDVMTVTPAGVAFTNKNAGTNKVLNVTGLSLSGSDAFNYVLASTSVATTASVSPAVLTATATAKNKTYDGTPAAAVQLGDNRIATDVLSLSAATTTFSDKNAGTSKAVVASGLSIAGADANNYVLNSTTASTTATITQASLTVNATGNNRTYDATTAATVLFDDNRISNDVLTISAPGATFADKNVGVAKTIAINAITVTGADASNYILQHHPATTQADITQATLIASATAVNKQYDTTTAAAVTLYDTPLGNDVVNITSTGAAFADKNAASGKTVTVSGLQISGADAGNYLLGATTTTTRADITPAVLTATASGLNKTYDASTTATVTLNDNRLGTDVLTLASTGATFADKNAGTGKTVTVSGLTINGTDAANYTLANTVATTRANINEAVLTAIATAVNKTYDATTAAAVTLGDNRLGNDVLSLTSTAATFTDKNAGAGKTVTTNGITVSGADAANYVLASTTATAKATINQAILTASATGVNKTYDTTTTAMVSLGDNRLANDVLSLANTSASFVDKNAGIGKTEIASGISISGIDAGNYVLASTTATTKADISQAVLTASATGINKTYDATTAASVVFGDNRLGNDVLNLTSTSAQFADKNVGDGKSIAVKGISINGADAANYMLATTTTATKADISQAVLTASATGVNKTYDTTTAATVTLGDNRLGNDVLSLAITSATFADKNAGTGKTVAVSGISVSGADAANYTLANTTATTQADISKAVLSASATGVNKTYDATTATSVTLGDNRLGNDVLSLSNTSATFIDKNAGLGKSVIVNGIGVTGTDAANYTLASTTVTTQADISQAVLTASATGINKTYDATTAVSVVFGDNRLGNDVLNLTSTSAQFADKNVGTGKAIAVNGIRINGTDAANYMLAATTTATKADISQAVLTASATGVNRTYDTTTAAAVTLGDNRLGNDVLSLAITSATFSDKNAGTAKSVAVSGISVSGTDATNYTLANTTATTQADISKAVLSASATGVNKTYDATTATSVTLADNRLGNDVLSLSNTSATFADKNAGRGKSVTVNGIGVTGADAANYTLASTTVTTQADIRQAVLTASATAVNKTYDATTTASVTLGDNRIGNDVLSVAATTATFADKNAGTNKTVTVSGMSVSGTDAANYTLANTTATTQADVSQAVLIASATGLNKTYDATTAAVVTLGDNRLGNDVLSLASTGATFADKNAGTSKTVSVSGIRATGTDAANYILANTTATTQADISQAVLTASATGVNKTYDATTVAAVTLGDNRLGNDVLSLTNTSATFADKNAGLGKSVTVNGIGVTGTDAANYTLANSTATTQADVSQAVLIASATGINKTYDATTTAAVTLGDNRLGNDVLRLANTSATFADKNAGTSKAVAVSGIGVTGTDAANYTLANATATTQADVSQAVLIASATGINKTYDATMTAAVTLGDNRLGNDVLSLANTSAVFSDKNAGANKTIAVNGIRVTGTDAANYTLASTTATTSADVSQAVLTASATAVNKTYDATTTATVTLGDNRLGNDTISLANTTATFADKNAGTNKAVTASGIRISGTDAANYTLANTTATTQADVSQAVLTASATGINKIYDATTTAAVTLGDNRLGNDVLSLASTGATFADKNAGTNKAVAVNGISVTGTDAANYTLANITTTTRADISQAVLTAGASGVNKTYDATTAAAVTFTDNRLGNDVLTLATTGATFADKNAGTNKAVAVSGISVAGADAANYTLANTTATTRADVSQAVLMASATGINKTYDATTGAAVTLGDNRLGNDVLTLANSGATFADKNAGTNKTVAVRGISVTGADAANYTLANTTATTQANVSQAVLSASATGVNKTYDATTTAAVTLGDNRLGTDVLSLASTDAVFTDKNAGMNKSVAVSGIRVNGADAVNYTLANNTATTQADISQAVLTASATGVNKTYDATTVATVTLGDNRLGRDVLTLANTGATFADKNAGTNKTVAVSGIRVTGTDAANYTLANTTATTQADVSQAVLTASATGINKTYDATTTAAVTLGDNRLGNDVLSLANTSATFTDKNAGANKAVAVSGIRVTGTDAANYTLANTTAATQADISQAVLTASATGINKTYDATTTAAVTLGDNRLGNDVLTLANTGAVFSDKNAGTGKTVTVSGMSVSGTDAANYTLATTAATTQANITQAVLTASATGVNKTYDATTTAAVTLGDNRLGNDVLTLANTGAVFSDKNAGTNKVVAVSGIRVTGIDAANYTLANTTATTQADVSQAILTASATGVNKTYDATTAASVTLGDNRLGNDILSLTNTTAIFADKNAGTGKAVAVSGMRISGTDAANYILGNATATTTADISQAVLTASATGVNKTYDATTAATVTLGDNRLGKDVLSLTNTTATFADKNAGTGKAVTVNGISVSGTDAANYSLANTTATTQADITQAVLTASATGVNKTYDATSLAAVTLGDNRLGNDVLSLATTGATFADKNAGTNKVVTVNGISVTGTDAANYTLANTTATTQADVSQAMLIASATGINKTYDATTAATVTLGDNRLGKDALSLANTTATFADKNAGTGKAVTVNGISVSGTDAANYTLANTTATTQADVSQAMLTASATGINKTYDATTAATVSLGDNRLGKDVLSLTNTTSTFADKNAGTGKAVAVNGIHVSGTDAANYSLATTTATTQADIRQAVLTASATGVNKTYDATTAATVSLGDNRLGNDVLTLANTGAVFSDKNAGTGKAVAVNGISVSGADAANYTLANSTATTQADITQAVLIASAIGINKTYDATTAATVSLGDNRLGNDVLTLANTGAVFSDKNAGTGKAVAVNGISVSGADAANYTLANSTATTQADISQAVLTASATGINKTYDATRAATVTMGDNRLGNDVLSLTNTSATFADKNAGTSKAVAVNGIRVTGADAANYTLANTTATTQADVSQAVLTASATGVNKTYDATTVATVTLGDNRLGTDVLSLSNTGAVFSDKNAGTDKTIAVRGMSVSGTDAANYTLASTTATTTADVSQAVLTASATGVNKTYDATTAAVVALGDNRLGNDVLNLANTTATFADKNAGTGKAVAVNGIRVSGADAANYTLANTTATTQADVSQAVLTASATGVNKTYDATTAAAVTLRDNRLGNDVLSLVNTSATFSDKNAGTNKAVAVSGIRVSGTDAANYTLANTTATTQADVSQAVLTVSATGVNKTYDATTAAAVTLGDNRLGNDVLSLANTGATFADKNAGTNKAVSVSGINMTGADAANYMLANTSALTQADVSQAVLIARATGVNKTYDATTAATVMLGDNRLGNDVLNLATTSATFADKNAGTNKTVTVNGMRVSGTDAANYTLANTTATTQADVSQAVLTASATGVNKTYDANTTATVTLGDNRLGNDVLSLANTSAAFADKNAGTGKTVTVNGISASGTDAANYSLANTTVTTQANVSQAVLTASATGANKTYDATTAATVTLGDNRLSGDVLTLANTGAVFSDKNAGTGKAVAVNGISVSGTDAANYTLANTTATTKADISQTVLTASATGVNKTYDATTAATVTLGDNRLGNDVLTLTTTGATFADKNAGTNKAVAVAGMSVTGADAANYTLGNTTATTQADVSQAVLTASATGVNKTYDATIAAVVMLGDNRLGNDVLSLATTGATFADKNAGTNKTVTVNGLRINGADAANYTLANTTATTVADVSQAVLTASATGANKTYDATTAATVTLGNNRLGNDVLTLTNTSATFADKNAGTGKTVAVNGISVSGADASNYILANVTATTQADISQAVLTASATGVNKTYDATAFATVMLGDNRLGNDVLTLTNTSATFADKNAGTGKTVTVSGVSVSGTDAANYILANIAATTQADISQAVLTARATGVNKTYDATTAALVIFSDNRLGTDAVHLTSVTAVFADKNIGSDKAIAVDGIAMGGADAGNYVLASRALTAKANITQALAITPVKVDEPVVAVIPAMDTANVVAVDLKPVISPQITPVITVTVDPVVGVSIAPVPLITFVAAPAATVVVPVVTISAITADLVNVTTPPAPTAATNLEASAGFGSAMASLAAATSNTPPEKRKKSTK